ncbi:hypothetical protein CLF_100181 [Clonorchis sinensis]|uniref:Uncharacterized protein n=1 Tax=Clonorchis sinensis TaxID=79923 RepID=G7Y2V4_CLOSI|nr:hypothetical protein CLF_100181 [Clonorchis sinensis]
MSFSLQRKHLLNEATQTNAAHNMCSNHRALCAPLYVCFFLLLTSCINSTFGIHVYTSVQTRRFPHQNWTWINNETTTTPLNKEMYQRDYVLPPLELRDEPQTIEPYFTPRKLSDYSELRNNYMSRQPPVFDNRHSASLHSRISKKPTNRVNSYPPWYADKYRRYQRDEADPFTDGIIPQPWNYQPRCRSCGRPLLQDSFCSDDFDEKQTIGNFRTNERVLAGGRAITNEVDLISNEPDIEKHKDARGLKTANKELMGPGYAGLPHSPVNQHPTHRVDIQLPIVSDVLVTHLLWPEKHVKLAVGYACTCVMLCPGENGLHLKNTIHLSTILIIRSTPKCLVTCSKLIYQTHLMVQLRAIHSSRKPLLTIPRTFLTDRMTSRNQIAAQSNHDDVMQSFLVGRHLSHITQEQSLSELRLGVFLAPQSPQPNTAERIGVPFFDRENVDPLLVH